MENDLIKYIVYCTTCTINNKIYIGVHKTNPNVYDSYLGNGVYSNNSCTYKYSKTKFLAAINKYGIKNFKRITIAIFDNEDDAYNLEASIVNEQFLQRSDIYNVALGGKSGNWILQAEKTYQYNNEGEFLYEYLSIKDASRAVNRDFRSLWRAINSKIKCAGYFWTNVKYDKLDLSKMHSYEGHEVIPVFQYNDKGEYECCYESIRGASRVLNIHSSNISDAIKLGTICKGKYYTNVYSPNFSIAKFKQIQSYQVHLYDLEGNYIASYNTMAEAKKATGIKSDIYKAIRLGRLAGNYLWSFEKLEKMSKVQSKSRRARKVGKYDKDWNLIKIYNTLQSCKNENGSGMIHVLTGRDLFAKGFRYKYID